MSFKLSPSSAFSRFPLASVAERGVLLSVRDRACLVLIRGRPNLAGALESRMKDRFAVELPHGPKRVQAAGLSVAGLGPQTWLAMDESGDHLAAALRHALGETAVIVEQSDEWAVLRISGPRAREVLAKLVAVDLHERAFTSGDMAVTAAALIEVMLWRVRDAENGEPVFEVAVPRSYARQLLARPFGERRLAASPTSHRQEIRLQATSTAGYLAAYGFFG